MATPQLYDSPGNYDFAGPGDDGTYDGLSANLNTRKAKNVYNSTEGDAKQLVTNNKKV